MKGFLNRLERRFGRYAVPHLTAVMIGCFAVGYLLQMLYPNAANYMSLDISEVLNGQVWRLLTWIIIPPSRMDLFTIVMLFFYFSIGTSLEKTWGDFRYNVYIIGGILVSILAAFLSYFILNAVHLGDAAAVEGGGFIAGLVKNQVAAHVGSFGGALFTTANICTSLLLAFSATFPDATVLLMFVIPVKMKYLGIVYGLSVAYECVTYVRYMSSDPCYVLGMVSILAAMLNFVLFFFMMRSEKRPTFAQRKRQKAFREAFSGKSRPTLKHTAGQHSADKVVEFRPYRHRCEICGKTEKSDPDAEFRYCSRCAGEHEYCMEHLYTHPHITPQ